ncbi:MAG: DUF1376 domain-containing protein [Acidithiobacillus sp.]
MPSDAQKLDCSTLLPPPVPADLDLRSYSWMKLDLNKLYSSNLIHLANNEEFGAAVKLWCESMRQVPAGSLPDDDRILASMAGYKNRQRRWQKVREMALHGFSLCSDGRLYHPVLSEMVLAAASCNRPTQHQVSATDQRSKDRERLRRWREAQKAKTQIETAETFQGNVSETADETVDIEREKEKEINKTFQGNVSETPKETFHPFQSETVQTTNVAGAPSREGNLCQQLQALGIRAAPHMIVVQEMCAKHPDEHILAAAEIALEKKGRGIHVGYIAAMLKNENNRSANGTKVKPPVSRSLIPPVEIPKRNVVAL